LGNLSTLKSVQKLQTALHAKAKAEAGYRFYALYDKISREDILAHAYAQSRSNKGALGVDGQEFADIEAYGVGTSQAALWGDVLLGVEGHPLQFLSLAIIQLQPEQIRPIEPHFLRRREVIEVISQQLGRVATQRSNEIALSTTAWCEKLGGRTARMRGRGPRVSAVGLAW
jgi:hypothetical protein